MFFYVHVAPKLTVDVESNYRVKIMDFITVWKIRVINDYRAAINNKKFLIIDYVQNSAVLGKKGQLRKILLFSP